MSVPPSPSPGGELGPGYERWRAAAAPLRRPMEPGKPRYWLHILLFVLTIGTTTLAYTLTFVPQLIMPNGSSVTPLMPGLTYSFWLLLILGCHEFGHYWAAKYHRVKATLPYFIPLPLPPLGTFGAVIRMSPYIPNRRALFDIAAAGPIAGIVVAIPIALWGVQQSAYSLPSDPGLGAIQLGDPLLIQGMAWLLLGPRPAGHEIVVPGDVFPVFFAAWVGMLVTALNLLPLSQLDGGHASYAVLTRKSRLLALSVFGALVVLMILNGWWHFALLLGLVWVAGLAHPPTMDDAIEIGRNRRIAAAVLLVVLILCFTPKPMSIM